MNILAHIYLSGNDPYIQLGNFMADAVKGNTFNIYAENVQKGIRLHRFIDSFTDADEMVRKSKRRLHSRYRHYDGVIIDILYDHFLAKNWNRFSKEPLDVFVQRFYEFLKGQTDVLPERIRKLTPYMIENDWLSSYAHFEGIAKVLSGMNRRTDGKSQMNLAIDDLKEKYTEFEADFFDFFPRLETAANKHLENLLKNSD